MEIAEGYKSKWNFPHCIGAIDGKHIQIEAPRNSGSIYFNYKGTFSIVLMAIVDAEYRIIYADVGSQGRISDGGVFHNTKFYDKLIKGELNIPQPRSLLGGTIRSPFVLVADDAFALSHHLMKPFPGSHESGSIGRIFNYRLSRARRVVENVFGLLATVFRVFRKPIQLEPAKVESIVLACVHLHNFLRRNTESRQLYTPPGTFDSENSNRGDIMPGSWREGTEGTGFLNLQNIARRPPGGCKEIRNEFARYFISPEGSVPWQNEVA